MSFVKLGESSQILSIENTESCIPAISEDVLNNFKKFAANLKKIAPKAEDFLYFSCTMLHAAEASAINDDGTPKLNIKGEPVKVGWDTSNGTYRWVSNDPNVKPYKNSNGDIFPEAELVKAYKKWVHKPLCIDHKSSSVDHVRGFIVDTYYDRVLKRVIGLCALDKHNYPDLARKVQTGYSNCVSMGTAVGRAVCTDCGTIARTEHDFCNHMRTKSGYGEINLDLNPIELSIVVNGADGKATIKHIIAAANTMNNYLDNRSKELNKIANNYSATLMVNSGSGNPNNSAEFTINSTDLNNFKDEIQAAFEKLEQFKKADFSEKDTNDIAFNQSSGSVAMEETALPNTDSRLAPPHDRYAEDSSLEQLKEVTAAIEDKLSQMKQSLDKLLHIKTTQEENNMPGSNDLNKKAYFQGTEEPTPGQAKYPKDPLNEKDRNSEDKQMVGQMDTGPVDGLHPGPDSVGMSELERKKMLARAAAEERALKRAAAVEAAKKSVEKKGYFQGGGGVNEPTPGKVKYPADKLNDDLRDSEDKQMVGQKPFPGVGNVDGLHPSPGSADVADELKRKELLQRASLKARFVKSANSDGTENINNSAWEVFLGDNLVLRASVNDLSGGRSEMMYDSIATKEFGAKLIEKIKSQGADKIRALVKKAQEVAPVAPPAAPPVDAAPVGDDTGASGDPKENAVELANKVRDLSSDLAEAVNSLTGEQAEMGDVGGLATAASDNSLNAIRKELNVSLIDAMKETIAQLDSNKQELETIAKMYENGSIASANKELVGSIVEEAFEEAKTSIADGFNLLNAFSKYARGTKVMIKKAEIEAELNALTDGDSMDKEDNHSSDDDLLSLINEANSDLDDVKDLMSEDDEHDLDLGDLESLDLNDEELDSDENDIMAKPEELKDLKVNPGTHVEVTASLDTREGRAALRAKLAAETLKFNPILNDAHPKGGVTTELDVKPEGDLAKIEDLEEEHDAMMDVATAPPKVRKEAEAIHRLISEGKLDKSDLDALVAEGLDKDAVSYYKKFYGQVDGGSEFASELVKEHVKAQMETELNDYKVKIARAYELAYDMVDRGLCHFDGKSVASQVEEIMTYNDSSFESLKKVIARHPITLGLRKEASGRMPQVGFIGSGEVHSKNAEMSLADELSAVLSKSSKMNF